MSDRPAYPYHPNRVSLSLGDVIIDGYADGVFFRGARDNDDTTLVSGAQGDSIVVRIPKQQGTISVMIHAGTAVGAELDALADDGPDGKIQFKPFQMKDNNGSDLVSASKAWVKRRADIEKGGEPGTQEWIIAAHDYKVVHGGLELA